MAEIFYMTKQTRDNMKLARKCILKTYEMVKLGRDKAAHRYATRAVDAYNLAIQQSRQPSQKNLIKSLFGFSNIAGDAALKPQGAKNVA